MTMNLSYPPTYESTEGGWTVYTNNKRPQSRVPIPNELEALLQMMGSRTNSLQTKPKHRLIPYFQVGRDHDATLTYFLRVYDIIGDIDEVQNFAEFLGLKMGVPRPMDISKELRVTGPEAQIKKFLMFMRWATYIPRQMPGTFFHSFVSSLEIRNSIPNQSKYNRLNTKALAEEILGSRLNLGELMAFGVSNVNIQKHWSMANFTTFKGAPEPQLRRQVDLVLKRSNSSQHFAFVGFEPWVHELINIVLAQHQHHYVSLWCWQNQIKTFRGLITANERLRYIPLQPHAVCFHTNGNSNGGSGDNLQAGIDFPLGCITSDLLEADLL